jgi:hypothetical protein
MNAVSLVITKFVNLFVLPFGTTHHTLELAWLSLLTGLGMAWAFKATSNQKAIKTAKDRIKAPILEMRLYQDDPILIFQGLGGALKGNFRYLGNILVPFMVIVIPMMIVFMQMDQRYSKAPLIPGSTTLLSVQLKEGFDPFTNEIALELDDALKIEGNPVRDAVTREMDWQIKVDRGGTHKVTLSVDVSSYVVPIVAEKSYRMIPFDRSDGAILEPLLHPALPPFPGDSPFERVRVEYPAKDHWLFGWHTHWIVLFFFWSLVSAASLKFLIGIEI